LETGIPTHATGRHGKVKKSCSALVRRDLRKTGEAFGRQRRMRDRRGCAGEKWCAVGWRLGMCSAQIGIEAGGARTNGRGGFRFGGPKRDLALSVAVTRVAPTACPRQLVGDSVLAATAQVR
jgi:hypothetical protein